MNDAALAAAIAEEAGALLLAIRADRAETGKALGDRGDREANALILARLASERSHDFVLSEESVDDPAERALCREAAVAALVLCTNDGTLPLAVGTRKKRMAITSEDPPAKALQPVATALRQVAGFVQEYTA